METYQETLNKMHLEKVSSLQEFFVQSTSLDQPNKTSMSPVSENNRCCENTPKLIQEKNKSEPSFIGVFI